MSPKDSLQGIIGYGKETARCDVLAGASEEFRHLNPSPPHVTSAVRKSGSILVTLPRIVTPYRDNVGETHDRVTYQKLVTR